jgi:hypothetical protein
MEQNFEKEQSYIRAKKRVKDIKGFYVHLIVFIAVNLFISGNIIFWSVKSGENFAEAITNFGVYSTPLFWGIGLFFHWFGVFGVKSVGFGKEWEERKIKEYLDKENEQFKQRK